MPEQAERWIDQDQAAGLARRRAARHRLARHGVAFEALRGADQKAHERAVHAGAAGQVDDEGDRAFGLGVDAGIQDLDILHVRQALHAHVDGVGAAGDLIRSGIGGGLGHATPAPSVNGMAVAPCVSRARAWVVAAGPPPSMSAISASRSLPAMSLTVTRVSLSPCILRTR